MLAHNAKLKINNSHTLPTRQNSIIKMLLFVCTTGLPMLFTEYLLLCKNSFPIHSKKIF